MNQHLEGRYANPFCRHEARWISAGTPTSLVGEAGTESHDERPDEPWSHGPEAIISVGGPNSSRRAGDAQHEGSDSERAIDAAQTATIWTNQP